MKKPTKDKWITIRVTEEEYKQIIEDAIEAGLDSVSAYMLMIYRTVKK